MDRVGEFLTREERQRILAFMIPPLQSTDRVVWQPSTAGTFTISSALEWIRPLSNPLISRKLIWNQCIPIKISIFMWHLLNNLLPFLDILRQFGLHLQAKCPFYPNEDSLTHCLVTCHASSQVWAWFEQGLRLHIGASDTLLLKLLGWWMHSSGKMLLATLANLLPVLICWELWKARNKAVFEDIVLSPAHVRHQVAALLNSIGEAYPLPYSAPQDSTFRHLGLKPPVALLRHRACVSLS